MVASKKLPVVRRQIEDVDAMSAAVTDGLTAEYVQLEAKPFTGQWLAFCAPNMVVQIGREDIAVVRRLRVPAKRWALVLPLRVPDSARWNASAVRPDDALLCGPGAECFAFDPAGTWFAVLSFETGTPMARRVSALARDCAPSSVAALLGAEAYALRRELLHISAGVDQAPEVVRSLVQTALAHAAPRNQQLESFVGRSRIVRRAEEFFRDHVGEPVSIADLSSVAGVSERSLRNAFYDVYTTSPKRYLKLWQLHQVRRALRSTDEDGTVTDVATLHGFYELGRFAGEYKALFGEAPSQTLHKARSRNTRAALGLA